MAYRKIGVLGGMGPAATVDFMHKIIAVTPASRDQDHVPLIVHAVPQIPDRTDAISAGNDGPFAGLRDGVRTLERAGAELIVIPCNTAHAWFDRLAATTPVRLLHIAEAVREALDNHPDGNVIALMATRGTVRAGFYQRWLRTPARTITVPPEDIQDDLAASIAAVKAGDVARGRELASQAGQRLLDIGATQLLLACTELPVALANTRLQEFCIDATACLAEACVAFSRGTEIAGGQR
jgi:aspartate racemase